MQLFITQFEQKWQIIKISDSEILNQIRKVLRMKIWDTFFVQNGDIRNQVKINDRDKQNIFWNIIETIQHTPTCDHNWLAIAMPNKRDKIELIVQKLSEIWIKNIYFWPSERSIIRQRNEKKAQRIHKIAKEAIEQSRWRYLPQIVFENDISKILKWKNIVVFDKSDTNLQNEYKFKNVAQPTIWIIWPEWWLTSNDYKNFWDKIKTVSLWDTVLRAETATIIAARLIQNLD